ncbi:MAG: AAA family ATPase [Sandaracinaceae bacterium]
MSAHLEAVRIGAFKSYREEELPLRPVTLLVGPNASGKSNALDALSLLSLLAEGRDVKDLERDDLEVAGLRGGVTGAAPFGESPLRVGCTVGGDGFQATLDIEIDTDDQPEIVSETLVVHEGGNAAKTLIQSVRQARGSGISDVRVYSGRNPKTYHLLSSRLASSQALGKVAGDTVARKLVLDTCEQVLQVLQGVFVLDPVPGAMREYVRIGSTPDRSGSKLSAIIRSLQDDPHAWSRLTELVRSLVGSNVEVTFAEAKLPDERIVDVMVALRETLGDREFTTDARLMSDGTLRYLSIVASLLHLRASQTGRTLVVEEIENGLFPSQASGVLNLLREEASDQGVRLLATTHSPALLDALRPADHAGVVICERRVDGLSHLSPLTAHPRYVEIAGSGAIGQAVTRGELGRTPSKRVTSVAELFGT